MSGRRRLGAAFSCAEVRVLRGDHAIALAQVAPWKGGAVATIWRVASEGEGLPNAMANGC